MSRSPLNRRTIYEYVCPICQKEVRIRKDEAWKADALITSDQYRWKWTQQVRSSDRWDLICPRHVDSQQSRTIYNDAENDRTKIDLPLY